TGDTARTRDVRSVVDVDHYRIDATIGENLELDETVEVRFHPIVDQVAWARFWIDGDLTADSLSWGDGRPAEFEQGRESPAIWVHCDPPLKLGDQAVLRLRLSGKKVVARSEDVMWLPNPVSWYPQHDFGDLATFDLTFHVPSQYQFASIGERTSSRTDRRVTTTTWRVATPVRNATFVMGV